MALPISPPIDPMLARLQGEIPRGEGWLYEPKWDGFRAIVFRDGDEVHIASRDRRPLERYFPELVAPLKGSLPPRCVVDGEVVIAGRDGLDFESLLLRIHPAASRIRLLASETPGSFVAFDLLAEGDDDLMNEPLWERRRKLEAIVPDETTFRPASSSTRPASTVMLTPQTSDPEEADAWFVEFEALGLDGIIAKRREQRYIPGQRVMVKVKHQRTADCVVGGYRLAKSGEGVGSLLLGLYDDAGVLHYVGHTSSFKARERRELLERLRPLEGGNSFGAGRTPGGPSRWSGKRDTTWVALDPALVCEVAYDHMQGDRFRHAATFVRWRPDKEARRCTFEQVRRG